MPQVTKPKSALFAGVSEAAYERAYNRLVQLRVEHSADPRNYNDDELLVAELAKTYDAQTKSAADQPDREEEQPTAMSHAQHQRIARRTSTKKT